MTKIKVTKVKENEEIDEPKIKLKHWDVCEGNCSQCWPKVYEACKSKKKVNRLILEMESMLEKKEEDEDKDNFFNKIVEQGYIEFEQKA
jgi:hypothetical protein